MSILNTKSLIALKRLNIPVYTDAQRDALIPIPGSIIYNSDAEGYQLFDGTEWTGALGVLYPFTTATFTPGGATLTDGPSLTQARSGLTGPEVNEWKNNTEFFNVSGGIQLWTVPADGTYSIDCYGAQGGRDGYYGVDGGLGARIKGDFSLTQGEVIRLVVGQRGQNDPGNAWGGGGGGGSFAWRSSSTSLPLIAAGGGGSGGTGGSTATAGGQTGTSGANGTNGSPGSGGTNGSAGTGGSCGGGGGNGWNGGFTSICGGSHTWSPLYNDPRGFTGGSSGARGGFGGGGGAWGGGGGGGGYSGGGAAGWSYSGRGGGGGSYNAGTNQIATGATRSGDGQIIITFLG